MGFCSRCGEPAQDDATFCANCGKPIHEEAPSPNPEPSTAADHRPEAGPPSAPPPPPPTSPPSPSPPPTAAVGTDMPPSTSKRPVAIGAVVAAVVGVVAVGAWSGLAAVEFRRYRRRRHRGCNNHHDRSGPLRNRFNYGASDRDLPHHDRSINHNAAPGHDYHHNTPGRPDLRP